MKIVAGTTASPLSVGGTTSAVAKDVSVWADGSVSTLTGSMHGYMPSVLLNTAW